MHNTTRSRLLAIAVGIVTSGAAACGGGAFEPGGDTPSPLKSDAAGAGGTLDAAVPESSQTAGTGGVPGSGGAIATGGQAGATAGSASASSAAGSAGAAGTSPSGGSAGAAGTSFDGGSAGAGGAAFDPCTIHSGPPPTDNNSCTAAICTKRPDCCTAPWSLKCALEARLEPLCGCSALECSASAYKTGISNACMSTAACNPVDNDGCGPAYHCLLMSEGDQLTTICQLTGSVAACGPCDNQYLACKEGHSCVAGHCVRLCCESGDCPAGSCAHDLLPAEIGAGVCVVP